MPFLHSPTRARAIANLGTRTYLSVERFYRYLPRHIHHTLIIVMFVDDIDSFSIIHQYSSHNPLQSNSLFSSFTIEVSRGRHQSSLIATPC